MEKAELAERYAARLKKCLLFIKIFVISAAVAVAALLVFIFVAWSTGMQNSNAAGLLTGVIVTGSAAVISVIAGLCCLIVAAVTIHKFKKLGADES